MQIIKLQDKINLYQGAGEVLACSDNASITCESDIAELVYLDKDEQPSKEYATVLPAMASGCEIIIY